MLEADFKHEGVRRPLAIIKGQISRDQYATILMSKRKNLCDTAEFLGNMLCKHNILCGDRELIIKIVILVNLFFIIIIP